MKIILSLLISTAFLGPSVSYGPIYAYHISIIITLAYIVFTGELANFFRYTFSSCKPWLILVIYSLLSITWSPNIRLGLQYEVYILSGAFLVFAIPFLLRKFIDRSFVKKLVVTLFSSHLIISLLEIFTPFRWSISNYSHMNHLFGKPNFDFPSFFEHYPTSFFFHQNQCALATVLFLPLIFNLSSKYRLVLVVLSYLVIFFSGSKSVLIISAFYGIYIILKTIKETKFISKTLLLLIPGILIVGFIAYKFSNEAQKSELNQTVSTFKGYTAPLVEYFVTKSKGEKFDFNQLHGNIQERYYFMEGALNIYKSSYVIGAGAGSHLGRSENINGTTVNLTSLHNYWLELLIQFGPAFLILYFIWFFGLVKKVKSTPFAECMILFFFGAPVLASAIYFLPKWLLYGLSLSEKDTTDGKPNI